MLNVVALVGGPTNTPLLSEKDNVKIASFTLAVTLGKDKSGFFDCKAFNKLAENISSVEKGTLIGLTGRLNQREWQTADGKKARATEVIVERFCYLQKKENKEPEQKLSSLDIDLPELPF